MPVPMSLPVECPPTFEELRGVVRQATARVARHRGFDFFATFVEHMDSDDLMGLLLVMSDTTAYLRFIWSEQTDDWTQQRAEWAACHVGVLHDRVMADFLRETVFAYPSNEADYESASGEWADFAFEVDQILAQPSDTNYHLVVGGDWGGQAYLTIPLRLLRCPEDTLRTLAQVLDRICWGCNQGDGVFLERRPADTGHYGMGGARYNPRGIWLTAELEPHRGDIERVLMRDAPLSSLQTHPYPEKPHAATHD